MKGELDLSLVWTVIVGLVALMGFGFMFLWPRTKDVEFGAAGDLEKAIAAVVDGLKTASAAKQVEHSDMWKAIDALRDSLVQHKEDCLQRYAVKDDVHLIREEIDRRFDRTGPRRPFAMALSSWSTGSTA